MLKGLCKLSVRVLSILIFASLIISTVLFFRNEKVNAATTHEVFWEISDKSSTSNRISKVVNAEVGDKVVLTISGQWTNYINASGVLNYLENPDKRIPVSRGNPLEEYVVSFEYEGNSESTYAYEYLGEFSIGSFNEFYSSRFTLTINWITPKYTVQFVDHDDTVLQSGSYESGQTPEYTEKEPTGYVDDKYVYTFSGWDAEIVAVTSDTTYHAQYSKSLRKFNVDFVNYDGTSLQSGEVEYGQVPSYGGKEPEKNGTDEFSYTFAGWTDGINNYDVSDALPAVTGEAKFTAVFDSSVNNYTVKFTDADGKELQSDSVAFGTVPTFTGTTPTKPDTEECTYTFAGWSDGNKTYSMNEDLPSVKGDVTYKAVFDSTANKYTVKFTDADGKELQSDSVAYGTVPAFNGTTPAKSETEKFTYTFAGWTDGTNKYGPTETLPAVKADVTYTAVFDEVAKPVSEPEPEKPVLPNDYYVDSIVGDGSQGSVVITVKAKGDIDNSFELLDRVEAGGKTLAIGSDIEVNQGSTIITLKKSYIDTLTDGVNSITVYFKDGGSITVNFNVKKAAATNASAVPATGEAMSISTFAGVGLIMTAVSLVGYNVMKKREEEN